MTSLRVVEKLLLVQLKNNFPFRMADLKATKREMIIFIVFIIYQFILLETSGSDLPLEVEDNYSTWTDKHKHCQDAQCSSTGTKATFENTIKPMIKHMEIYSNQWTLTMTNSMINPSCSSYPSSVHSECAI